MTFFEHSEEITVLNQLLNSHSVYGEVKSIEDLRCFMEHQIYSVWDYMSMIKYLQSKTAPTQYPWVPQGDGAVRRFINELVMEEESDEGLSEGEYRSHYELYGQAMREIGAETKPSEVFVQLVMEKGLVEAFVQSDIPEASKAFVEQTFQWLASDQPHCVSAALALGREKIIPEMFEAFLKSSQITKEDAPIFHYYLKRHIELDGGSHAPLSIRLLDLMCGGDKKKVEEAHQTVVEALRARIVFWDGVEQAILKRRTTHVLEEKLPGLTLG